MNLMTGRPDAASNICGGQGRCSDLGRIRRDENDAARFPGTHGGEHRSSHVQRWKQKIVQNRVDLFRLRFVKQLRHMRGSSGAHEDIETASGTTNL
jgi:hypothetical protein